MRVSRPARLALYVFPLAAGAALAALWVRSTGGAALARGLVQARVVPLAIALLLTTGWLFARFTRWQFLLRQVGVRVPIRPSLASYLAALPGTVTPAYVGEMLRAVFMRRRFHIPLRSTLPILVLVRAYHVAALAIVVGVTARSWNGAGLSMLFLALSTLLAALRPVLRRLGATPSSLARLRTLRSVGPALALSLIGWTLASCLVAAAAASLGIALDAREGAHVFASATLLGALTLLPAGAGATGTLAILDLSRLGVPTESAVVLVSIVRLASTGFAVAVGLVFLWRELRRGADRPAEGAAHFDAIADEYNA